MFCISNKPYVKKDLYVIGLMFFWIFMCFSQNQSSTIDAGRVERPMKIEEYSGIANYNYILKDRDTLLNGIFQLKKDINTSNLNEKEKRFFSFIGAFSNNVPVKNWQFTFGEFKPNTKSSVVDYKYVIELNGLKELVKGRFDSGKPQGLWSVRSDSIKDSDVISTLFLSEVELNDGIPQKNLRIKTPKVSLVGRFLRNGYAHDQWSLFPKEGIDDAEHWYFDHGKLDLVEVIRNGQKTDIPIFKNIEKDLVTVHMDDRYIDILKLSQVHYNQNQFLTEGIGALLLQNDGYYDRIERILSNLGESVKITLSKVKVPYYPLTSLEKEALDQITTTILHCKQITTSILDNTQLNISKLSNPVMANLFNDTEQILQKYIVPLDNLVYYHKHDLLHHKQRNQLITYLFPKGVPSITPSVQSFEEFLTPLVSKDEYLMLDGTDISKLTQLTTAIKHLLDAFDASLEKRISKVKRQEKILEEEEKLIEKAKKLSDTINSLKTTLPSQSKEALVGLNNYINKILSDYSNQNQSQGKIGLVKNLNSCFSDIEHLILRIAELPEQRKTIEKLYTEPMWNPFTSTTMNEIVKKRIYDAYDKILLPYLLTEIGKQPHCDTFVDQHQIFEDIFVKLKALRKEDTYKLERKLRRVKNPKTVMNLLGVTYKAVEDK
ncbi:hypothetical protein J8281_07765 [Aquimarina sp. U1-2]|uniref:hypothetical protein n=1 Tax=Aquimarina sp. U1-2 TaxID=2823141 RepID=UPI001AED07C6|nr:hypothetical protein [Aquimarina sp. U1-2]MBP2832085.1 hypothetical protein [Aquimarina sp. U1-2]